MKFTFRQLSYFIAAGETGSITLASKRANISQPAISTAISHIERQLDVQLFLRHHAQGLSLTPAGRALLRDAKQLLKQAEGLYCAAADIGHHLRGELSVGWFSTLAPIVMPELVGSFLKAYPETRIRSTESHQEGLLGSLRRAETELAITYDLQISDDIAFLPLATLPPYALFGAAHPLAGDSPALRIGIATLKELKKTRLVEAFERHCEELISEAYIPGMAAAAVRPRRARALLRRT